MLKPPRAASVALLLSTLCSPAFLSAPARAEAPAISALPDVVVLYNGGMLRGAIVELVPGETVSIALPTGETRTIAMDEVAFAGPSNAAPWNRPSAEAAPRAPALPEEKEAEGEKVEPFITVHAERARLKLVSKEPNLTVHVKSGAATGTDVQSDAYTTICTAPCEASLPTGTHELGISRSGGRMHSLDASVQITGPGALEVSFISRKKTRIAGYVLIPAGLAGGAGLMISSEVKDHGTFIAGTVVLLGGVITGAVLATTPDRATVAFIPGVATPASPDPTAPARDMQSASLFGTPGFTVVGTF